MTTNTESSESDESLLLTLPVLAGLSALGIAQPLLGLYGDNPSALAAARLSSGQIWVFLLLVALVPVGFATLTLLLARRFSPRVQAVVRATWIVVFLGLFALVLMRKFEFSTFPTVVLAAGLTTVLSVAVLNVPALTSMSRYLAVLLPATVVLFVFNSPSGRILRLDDAEAVPLQASGSDPVLFLVLDELMLSPLLTSDGEINGEKFPGFARLAQDSTWHRDTVTVHMKSEKAVPAILSGDMPRSGGQPYSWDHPESIFTLFGASREMDVFESFTALCPDAVCNATDRPEQATQQVAEGSVSHFLRDASVVYGHLSLPPVGRDRLPAIDQSWSGFGVGQVEVLETLEADALDPSVGDFSHTPAIEALHDTQAAIGQLQVLEEMVDRMIDRTDGEHAVSVYHGLVPHRPWWSSVDGRSYEFRNSGDDTEPKLREQYQAMTMQVAALDQALLRSINRLEDAGLWDQALVVVVSDHGLIFEVDHEGPRLQMSKVEPSDIDSLRVPMFIKAPGQTEGAVSDCPAMTIDALPTLVGLLGVASPFDFDGVDLSEGCPDGRERLTGEVDGRTIANLSGLDLLLERVERYDAWSPADGDIHDIVAFGRSVDLVGVDVSDNPTTDDIIEWTVRDLDVLTDLPPEPVWGSAILAHFVGAVELGAEMPEGTEGLILVDGRVAGIVYHLDGAAPGRFGYSTMIDVTLLGPGTPELRMAIHYPDGTIEIGPLVAS